MHGLLEFYLRGPYSLPKNRDPVETDLQSSILVDSVGLGATSIGEDGHLQNSIAIDNANATLAGGGHDEKTTKTEKKKPRPLILYAYSGTETALENPRYFVTNGLHGAADFVFVLNGPTDAASMLIPRDRPNVRVVSRPNTCYDLGSHGEVLRKDGLWKGYDRFIVLNASVRGPFVPYWNGACWSDVYLDRVTEKVKPVGMTVNCRLQMHVQSMIWATDSIGMELLLYPRRDESEGDGGRLVALQGCYNEKDVAIGAEVGATAVIQGAGYEVDAMMAAFHGGSSGQDYCESESGIGAGAGDGLFDSAYFGTNVHPYETVFFKANRGIDPRTLDLLTAWHRSGHMGNGSWDACSSL
ncbi:hypothetical protein DL769_001005 [Monosporascus sp. CRB-8-3]|nr:hypothetical protein DL769_001005 [Monosporascus sp. CRB-8-3]